MSRTTPASRTASWARSSCRRCATRPSASAPVSSPTWRRRSSPARTASRTASTSAARSCRRARSSSPWGPSTRSSACPGRRSSAAAASPTAPPATPPSSRTSRPSSSAAATPRWRRRSSSPSSPRKVVIVNRRDEFRASKIMLERARETGNIEFLTPYVVDEFHAGEDGKALDHARLRNVETGEERDIEMDGAFIAIGHEPQSEIVRGDRRARRERLRHRGPLHAHQRPRALRRRRPRRPHLPAGHHGRRLRLPGRPGRRVVPARHPRHPDARGARGRRRSRRGPVGPGAVAGLARRRARRGSAPRREGVAGVEVALRLDVHVGVDGARPASCGCSSPRCRRGCPCGASGSGGGASRPRSTPPR